MNIRLNDAKLICRIHPDIGCSDIGCSDIDCSVIDCSVEGVLPLAFDLSKVIFFDTEMEDPIL